MGSELLGPIENVRFPADGVGDRLMSTDDAAVPDEDPRPDSTPDDVETVLGDVTPKKDRSKTDSGRASDDWLLRGCARVDHDGESLPALGRNALLRRIGAGGMGFVYEGIQTHLGRRVAIKIVDQGLLERHPETADRFLREARLAAQMSSPYLVQVFDVDRDEPSGLHYLVMEFVEGQTAAQWREKHADVTEAQALEIVTAATRGLLHVHAAGIVHRDVKPENILLPNDPAGAPLLGAAKLADLGLARPDDGTGITRTSSGFGTPGFMSPEQAADARTVGPSADVFSMGATLYALLSGRTPFHGTTPMEVMLATMNGDRESVDTLADSVSAPTLALLERALATDPEERHADAPALLEALESAAGTARAEAVVAPPLGEPAIPAAAHRAGEGTPPASSSAPPPRRDTPATRRAEQDTSSSTPGRPPILRGPLLVAAAVGLAFAAEEFLHLTRDHTHALVLVFVATAVLFEVANRRVRRAERESGSRLRGRHAGVAFIALGVVVGSAFGLSDYQHTRERSFINVTTDLMRGFTPARALGAVDARRDVARMLGVSSRTDYRLRQLDEETYRTLFLPRVLTALHARLDNASITDGGEELLEAWSDVSAALHVLRSVDQAKARRGMRMVNGVKVDGVENVFFTEEEVATFLRMRREFTEAEVIPPVTPTDEGVDFPANVLAPLWRHGIAQFTKSISGEKTYERMNALQPAFHERVSEWVEEADADLGAGEFELEYLLDRVEDFNSACADQLPQLEEGADRDELVRMIELLRSALDREVGRLTVDGASWREIVTTHGHLMTLLSEEQRASIPGFDDLGLRVKVFDDASVLSGHDEAVAMLSDALRELHAQWKDTDGSHVTFSPTADSLAHADELISQQLAAADSAWRDRVVPSLATLAGAPSREAYEEIAGRPGHVVEVLAFALVREALVGDFLRASSSGSYDDLRQRLLDLRAEAVQSERLRNALHPDALYRDAADLAATPGSILRPSSEPAPSSELRRLAIAAVEGDGSGMAPALERATDDRVRAIVETIDGKTAHAVLQQWVSTDGAIAELEWALVELVDADWSQPRSGALGLKAAERLAKSVRGFGRELQDLSGELAYVRHEELPLLLEFNEKDLFLSEPHAFRMLARGAGSGAGVSWRTARRPSFPRFARVLADQVGKAVREVERDHLRVAAIALNGRWDRVREDMASRIDRGETLRSDHADYRVLMSQMKALFGRDLLDATNAAKVEGARVTEEFLEFARFDELGDRLAGGMAITLVNDAVPTVPDETLELATLQLVLHAKDGTVVESPRYSPDAGVDPFRVDWSPGAFTRVELVMASDDGKTRDTFREWTGANCVLRALYDGGLLTTAEQPIDWRGAEGRWRASNTTPARFHVESTRPALLERALRRTFEHGPKTLPAVLPSTCVTID